MEHAQRDTEKNVSSAKEFVVLILILMEHAQRDIGSKEEQNSLKGLNPYFNGTCSKSGIKKISDRKKRS